MVETRRSSSSSKRPIDSTLPPPKRSKDSKAVGKAVEIGSDDLKPKFSGKSVDVEKTDVKDGNLVIMEEKDRKVAGKRQRVKWSCKTESVAWGRLISESPENPTLPIYNSEFTIGFGRQYDLCLREASSSKMLCKLHRIEQGGSSVAGLDITEAKVTVNNMGHQKTSSSSPITVVGGDELIFDERYAYIFQQVSEDTVAASSVPPPLPVLEAQSAPATRKDSRARDASAVVGAMTSKSNVSKHLSRLPLSTGNDEDSAPSSLSGASDNAICTVDMSDMEDYSSPTLTHKDAVPLSDENMNIDDQERDTAGLDIDEGTIAGSKKKLKPLLKLLSGSPPVDADSNRSFSKLLDDSQFTKLVEERKRLRKRFEGPIFESTHREEFKDTLLKGMLRSSEIDVSLETFPYYLSEITKSILIAAAYIPLKNNKLLKYASALPTVCPRILLSGPSGSEIYQETLVKALAKHFSAKLLIVESPLLARRPTLKIADISKEDTIPEKASLHAKMAALSALRLKNPPSSVEADITIERSLKNEASTASSKQYSFKEGDRVKFVGSSSTSPSLVTLLPQPRNISRSSHFKGTLRKCNSKTTKGPSYGSRGKVTLVFKGNKNSKIGVRFDESVPNGCNLGGSCETGHGFFCSAERLCLENSGSDDHTKLAINEICEVAKDECRNGPLILLLKDMEKCMAANPEAFPELKSKLEKLPDNSVVIASHTQADSRKEKSHPGSLLFTKFGSNTAFLDLALSDSLGRFGDKNIKDASKTMKQLNRLFTNKISIQMPQDEDLLSDWKQKLERDTETLKAQSNIISIRSVLLLLYLYLQFTCS